MRRALSIAIVLSLAACGGSTQRAETTTASSETTTLESSVDTTSDGEPRATSEPSDSHAAGRVGTRASATTSDAAADAAGEGPSADLEDYARRTMVIVRRHWTIPATLGPGEAAGLSSSISILIDETTHLATGYRILTQSGNAIFDESVHRGLQALVDANTRMPEPPAGLDDRASVRLRLTGR